MNTIVRRRLPQVCMLIATLWIASGCGGAAGGDLDQDDPSNVGELLDQCDELRAALERANDQIREANDQMNDARALAGSTYAEMEEALSRLEDVDEVAEP